MPQFRVLAALFLLAMLVGCAGTPVDPLPPPSVPPPQPPAKPAEGPQIRAYPRPPQPQTQARPQPSRAVAALLKRAEQQRQAGQLDNAAALLERALRIAPNDPLPWNRLAHVRLEQGRLTQAASLAARSNALPGVSAELRADNQRILQLAH